VVVAAVVVTTAAVAWNASRWLASRSRAVGDGHTVASYGFDLSTCLVPRETLVAAGMPKDGLPALVRPRAWSLLELEAFPARRRGRLIVPSDRVAGVVVGGQARAYPLRIMAWHEVADDELGGEPIAVSYQPLCGSVVAFSRRVGGETLTFANSGLVSNSGQLLYDRRGDGTRESLWSPLCLRAVAGPATLWGARLEPLSMVVTTWARWQRAHPDTTILAPDPALLDDYRRDPYTSYFGSDQLRFPVEPLPPDNGAPRKTLTLVAVVGGRFFAFPVSTVAAAAGPDGCWDTTAGGASLRLCWADDPPILTIDPDQVAPIPSITTFLFAWYAAHPADTTWVQ
jgi:hypothetical protein